MVLFSGHFDFRGYIKWIFLISRKMVDAWSKDRTFEGAKRANTHVWHVFITSYLYLDIYSRRFCIWTRSEPTPSLMFAWCVPLSQGFLTQVAEHRKPQWNWMRKVECWSVCHSVQMGDTPWKINMEPTNLPFRKQNDLPNLHDDVPCQSSGLQGSMETLFRFSDVLGMSYRMVTFCLFNTNITDTYKSPKITAKFRKYAETQNEAGASPFAIHFQVPCLYWLDHQVVVFGRLSGADASWIACFWSLGNSKLLQNWRQKLCWQVVYFHIIRPLDHGIWCKKTPPSSFGSTFEDVAIYETSLELRKLSSVTEQLGRSQSLRKLAKTTIRRNKMPIECKDLYVHLSNYWYISNCKLWWVMCRL